MKPSVHKGYDDVPMPAQAMTSTGAFRPPDWALFRTGAGSDGVMLPRFSRVASAPFPGQTKDLMVSFQLPHRYKRFSDIYLHLHWSPGSSGAVVGNVAWKIEYSVAPITGVFPTTSILDFTQACGGVSYAHQVTSDQLISGANLQESAILVGRIYRDSAGDTWASDNAFLLGVDLHVYTTRLGSRLRFWPWD
jgi:hypothetical protein